jgi:DNA-binding XRE family transcriptional regulator
MTAESITNVAEIRHGLGLSQAQLADLMGVSARAVQSWEQGWRHPSPALERSLLLLLMAVRQAESFGSRRCWDTVGCPAEEREKCLAYRSRQGHLCWFLTGNICQGERLRTWSDKKAKCNSCSFFKALLTASGPAHSR